MTETIDVRELFEINYKDATEDYDEQVVNMTYELFVNKLYFELTKEIQKAYQEKRYQDLKVYFHNFKTTSKYLGADNFSELCNKIQLTLKEGKEDLPEFEKLYTIFTENFQHFYFVCKQNYYQIMNIETDDSEDDSDSSEKKSSFSDSESENESESGTEDEDKSFNSENEDETPKTPRCKTKLCIQDSKLRPKRKLTYSRKLTCLRKNFSSLLRLTSSELLNEEKFTLGYHILTQKHEKAEIDSILSQYYEKFIKNKNFFEELKKNIENNDYENIILALNKIIDTLNIVLTGKFTLFLTHYINLLLGKIKPSFEPEILRKVKCLHNEISEMFEKESKIKKQRSIKTLKKMEKVKAVKNIENISKTSNLVTIPEIKHFQRFGSMSTEGSSLNLNFENIKELKGIERGLMKSYKENSPEEFLIMLKNFRVFLRKNKYLFMEKRVENYMLQLEKKKQLKNFDLNLVLEDINSVQCDFVDDCCSKTSNEVSYEDSQKTILDDLKSSVNYNWYFSGLSEGKYDFGEEKEEERVKTRRKDHHSEETCECSFQTSNSSSCIIM